MTADSHLMPSSAPEALSDEVLVQRVLAGETAFYELLMRRHNARLYRTARAIVRDDLEAEDVMQEAYVRAWAHLAQFDGKARFSTWLTKIAVHEAFARVRHRQRLTLVEDMPVSSEEDDVMSAFVSAPRGPEQEASAQQMRRLLEASVEALAEPYRAVFVLRDVNEMSTAEAAECLGITEEAVKTRLHRARALLRKELFARAGAAAAEVFSFHASRCDRVVAAVMERIARGHV